MGEEITSLLSENRIFNPSPDFSNGAHIKSFEQYKDIYNKSIANPQAFCAEQAKELHWFKQWDSVFHYTDKPFVRWFEGGKLNVCYNCLDRHLLTWRKNKAAIIWQGEPEEDVKIFT